MQGAGNSTSVLKYSFVDNASVYGKVYYRLTQTDYDGTSEIFSPQLIEITSLHEVSVSPNPVSSRQSLTILTGADPLEELTLLLYNSNGVVVENKKISDNSFYTFLIDSNYEPGMYLLKVYSGSTQITKRLIIR